MREPKRVRHLKLTVVALVILTIACGGTNPDPFSTLIIPPQVPYTPAREFPNADGGFEFELSIDPIEPHARADGEPDYAGFYLPQRMLSIGGNLWPAPEVALGFAFSISNGDKHRVNDMWHVEAPQTNVIQWRVHPTFMIPLLDNPRPGQGAWFVLRPEVYHETIPMARVHRHESDKDKFLKLGGSAWLGFAASARWSFLAGARWWTTYQVQDWVHDESAMELEHKSAPLLWFAGIQYDVVGERSGARIQLRGIFPERRSDRMRYDPMLSLTVTFMFWGIDEAQPPAAASTGVPRLDPDDMQIEMGF